jgi:hypothetical protein
MTDKFYKLKFKLNYKIFPKNLIFMSQELHFSISVVDPFVNVFVIKNVLSIVLKGKMSHV